MMTHAAGAAVARAPERDGPRAGRAGGEARADREPLAAAAGAGPPASPWRFARWRRPSSTRSISITTCSTCRARACRRWNLKRTSFALGAHQVGAVRRRHRHQPAAGRRARAAAYQPARGGQRRVHHRLPGEDQTRKLAMVGDIKRELASVHFDEPDPKPVDLQELSAHALLAARLPRRGAGRGAEGRSRT